MKLILLIFILLPTLSYTQFYLKNTRLYNSTSEPLYNPNDNFHIGVVNRIGGASIIHGEKYNKVILLSTTMLEFLFGQPNSFFYTSARFSTPIVPSSKQDQQNYIISSINDLKVGIAVGGGYGINNQNPSTGIGHGFNIILALTADFRVYNPQKDLTQEKLFNLLIFGTEIMFRYQYYYRKHSSLVLGFDIGMNIKPKNEAYITFPTYVSSIILTYGGVFGFRF